MAIKLNLNVNKNKEQKKVAFEPEQDVISVLDTHELSLGLFLYTTSKMELLEYMQPHCIDVAMIEYCDRDELLEMVSIINFKSTILIYDKYSLFDERGRTVLERKGYEENGYGFFNGKKVYEYIKNSSKSYIQAFDKLLNPDIISLLVIGELSFDTLAYCDSLEMIDMMYYSLKKGRSLVMPIKFNDALYANEYLEEKEQKQIPFKANKTQYLIF